MPETFFAPWVILELKTLPIDGGQFFPVVIPDAGEADFRLEFRQSTNPNNLRIEFQIENYGFVYPAFGYMNLVVSNASRQGQLWEAVNAVNTITLVRLYVGYETWACPDLVFQGYATDILDAYLQPDDQMRFYCQFMALGRRYSLTILPDAPLFEVLERAFLQSSSDYQLWPTPADVTRDSFFPQSIALRTLRGLSNIKKPKVVHGTMGDIISCLQDLFQISLYLSSTSISIADAKDNEPICYALGDIERERVMNFNYNSGLIGSPTFYTNGNQVAFQTVLNPRIQFGTVFAFEDIGGILNGPTGTAINAYNTRLNCNIGTPKLFSHIGDTRGEAWRTEVTGLLFDNIYIPPVL